MKTVTIPCSFDNYSYLLVCEKTGTAAVVDPTESFTVMRELETYQATLTTVLCTHHHHDHVGDIGILLEEIPSLEVYCHTSDRQRIPHANRFVDHGDNITIGESTGTVLHTPGHTSGSVCYQYGDSLFTGDTLFGAGCGRLFEGTPEQMYHSLNKYIARLQDDSKLYFGHEYTIKNLEFALTVDPENGDIQQRLTDLQNGTISTPTTLGLEKKTNPFLRGDSNNIKTQLQQSLNKTFQSPLEVFTALRELRNTF